MLLGRDRERQELERLLASARSGHSCVLGLVGEPGIGKTALLDYAAGRAGTMQVLRARGIESETNVPFAALLELLRPALGALGRIPAPQATALEVALALRPGAAGDRFAVGAGTLSLLATFADESPLLLLVDDAHGLDDASAGALLFALRRLLAEPVAALLAVRSGEASLLDDADLPTLPLSGLDPESSTALLGPLPTDLATRLHRATGGNPLALLALASEREQLEPAPVTAPIPLPKTISGAFARRAHALERSAQRLLLLVAASDVAELATLERAAGSLGLDLGGLEAAQQAGLLSVKDGRVGFSHPLARAAIYGEALPQARREAHRALAGAQPDRDADRRAWHLSLAAVGTDETAASALEQAGLRAQARSAYAAAAAAFERAARLSADEAVRGRRLFDAADCDWLCGSGERAAALLSEAEGLGADDERRIEIEHLRGRIATRRGPVMHGHEILVAAAERAATHDPERAITMLAEAVDASFFAGDARAMASAAQRAQSLLRPDASTRARFLAAMARGMAGVVGGAAEQGIASIRQAVALAERSEQVRGELQLLPWLIMGPLWLREVDTGHTLVETAIESARARAAIGILPWLLNRVARSHATTESWAAAEVAYDEAIGLAREAGQRTELAAALAGLAWLEARQGREQRCRAHAGEARELCDALGLALYACWTTRAIGELELALGRPLEAANHFEQLDADLAALAVFDVDLAPAAELVDAYLRLGRREQAAAVAERFVGAAREKGQPWSLARAERCCGLLGEDDFERHFEQALRLHEQTPDAFESACTRFAYGERLRRARQRRRARVQLGSALAVFDRLGAAPWSALAADELAASGETARRRDPSTLDELTPQELHIAHLLASGRTTRQTAAALFLSPKTIEYHLRSVYRKLGVNSREQLARSLPPWSYGAAGRGQPS